MGAAEGLQQIFQALGGDCYLHQCLWRLFSLPDDDSTTNKATCGRFGRGVEPVAHSARVHRTAARALPAHSRVHQPHAPRSLLHHPGLLYCAAVYYDDGVQRPGGHHQPPRHARVPLPGRPVRAHRRLHVLHGWHRDHSRRREQPHQPWDISFGIGYRFSVQLKMFLAIMTYITFALNFWVPSCLVWYYAACHHRPEKHWFWERVYRVLLVIMTNVVAILVPSIAVFIGLLGSFCVSVLGMIIPTFIALSLDWTDPGLGKCYWRVWKAAFFVLLGLSLCCVGTFANIRELVIQLTDPNNRVGIRAYS